MGRAAAGITSGPVLRPVSKGGLVGAGPVTAQAVFETVIRYARLAGLGKVTPHDLRRTFAKLAHKGRAPLEQIQIRSTTNNSKYGVVRPAGWLSSGNSATCPNLPRLPRTRPSRARLASGTQTGAARTGRLLVKSYLALRLCALEPPQWPPHLSIHSIVGFHNKLECAGVRPCGWTVSGERIDRGWSLWR